MMQTIYNPFLLSVTIWLVCDSAFVLGQEFVSREYQLALDSIDEAWEARRLEQISQEELSQRIKDALKAIGAELMKSYWAGVNTYGVPDPNELLFEDSNPIMYHDGNDGIRWYTGILAHGDYAQLKLIVRSRKPEYNRGERVWLKFFVRNDSDSEVHVCCWPSNYYCAHYWKLFHSNYDEVLKTPKWEEEFQKRKSQGIYGPSWSVGGGPPRHLKLQPGQEAGLDRRCLNDLFDLSKPDTYELTCFTTSIIDGQEYQPPLQSNTLTFRVLDEPVAADYWDRDGVTPRVREPQDAPYTNPPPGEEVFKQPKPPKNVFYIHVKPGFSVPIDVSPTAIQRQWEKERNAQATQPPDAVKPPDE